MKSSAQHATITLADVDIYRGERSVIQRACAHVAAGEFLVLAGRNGSGKTSLLRSIAGMVPYRGSIRIGPHESSCLSTGERAHLIAYLPQEFDWCIPYTVFDFVALGRRMWARSAWRLSRDEESMVRSCLDRVSLGSHEKQTVHSLSGGEKQRALLAFALAQQPNIMLLDEPTASLDPAQRSHAWELMHAINREQGVTVVVATHDLDGALPYASRVFSIVDGRLGCEAIPSQFRTQDSLSRVYGSYASRKRVDERSGQLVHVRSP